MDPDMFYPDPSDAAGVERAKRVCASCPVIFECFEDALGRGDRHGIWGGKTAGQRAHIRRGRGVSA